MYLCKKCSQEDYSAVFNGGICKGLNRKISVGGHKYPTLIIGDRLLCERAQMNKTIKNTSEIINGVIPQHHRYFRRIRELYLEKMI